MVSTFVNPGKPDGRQSFAHLPQILEVPNLIEVQLNSFRWFQEKGLEQLFKEISPIKDFTGSRLDLSFVGYEFREPAAHRTGMPAKRPYLFCSPLCHRPLIG